MPLGSRPRIGSALGMAGLMVLLASLDYTVQPGDSLWKIADQHGVSVAQLVEANDIDDPNLILVGQKLAIPGSDESGDGVVYHVVQPGETLAKIAEKYGVTVEELAEANGFPDPNLIYPGNRLAIGGEKPEFEAEITGEKSGSHVVTRGDTLATIAVVHGTTIKALVDANAIADPNVILIGTRLTIPGSGGWRCPVPGGTFINDWGFPRSGGRFHEGNDIYAAAGSPVHAPVSGVVEQVDGSRGGLQFWLEGDDGVLYIGTHMSKFGASGRISAGELVGYVGDSGNAAGASPHLHFEIHPVYNNPVNPYPTLLEACG